MGCLDFLRSSFAIMQKKLSDWLGRVKVLLEKLYIFKLIFLLKKKIDTSLLFFSLFILWGFCSITVSRGAAIWYFGWWAHLNAYLFSTSIYFLLSIVIIFKRYLRDKGHFRIFKDNRAKLKLYEDYVCKKYKIEINLAFKRAGRFFLVFTFLFYNLFFYFKTAVFLWVLLLLSLNLFLYFLNSMYLWWFFFKTPMPEDIVLEPPRLISFFFTRVLRRDYTTASKFWTTGRKDFIPVVGAVGAVIAAAVTADTAIAAHSGETTHLQRMDDRYSRGWIALDPKTRSRMTMLQSSGEDPSRYYNGEFVLDQRRVNIGYAQYKKAGFPENFKADLRED